MKRRFLSLVLIISLLAGLLTALPVTTSAYALGDVNGDGRVNALDANVLYHSIVGGEGTAKLAGLMGDINGDKKVNSIDAILLSLSFLGKYEISATAYNCKSVEIDGADLSEFTVVLPTEGPEGAYFENAQYASELLVTYIKEACGLNLPVSHVPAEHNIFITFDEAMGTEAFEIKAQNGNVYLRCGLLRGPMYAAFGFLEEIMGMRFYPRNVVTTANSDKIEIESGYTHAEGLNTSFRLRDPYTASSISNYRGAYYKTYQLGCLSSHITGMGDSGSWKHSRKFGSLCTNNTNHSMYSLVPESVPEGQDGLYTCFCFTNKDYRNTCETSLRGVINALLGKGYELGRDMPFISVSMNDSPDWCSCRNCRNFINAHGGVPSSTLVDFLNDMSDRLTPDYPGVQFWTLAYQITVKAPADMTLRDNIYVCFAPIGHCMLHPFGDNCYPEGAGNVTEIEGWKKLTDNIHCWWYGCNYLMTLFSVPQLEWVYDNVKYLASLGVKGSFYETEEQTFGFNDLTAYLVSELTWNPDITRDEYLEIIRRFCADYYGSGYVYDILMLMEDVKNDAHLQVLGYSPDGLNLLDASKTLARYEEFYTLKASAENECTDPEKRARMDRALLGCESSVISVCHDALYKNGAGETKAAFTDRYNDFYDKIVALGDSCIFSVFYGVMNATVPETFNPELSPYDWYFVK